MITGINVQYSNQDQYQHFEDGSSIVYVVSISLLENKLIDRNIHMDDANKFKDEGFGNERFRNKIKFKDTIFRESALKVGTDPLGFINDTLNTSLQRSSVGASRDPNHPPSTPG